MAVFAVSITKEADWRDAMREFSNVYHFKTDVGEPFDDLGVINKVVAAEKLIHSSDVKFTRARTWGPTEQGQSANLMREVVQLSGAGSMAASSNYYAEMAIMVYWPLGRYGSRNHPQYLRKWLHCHNNHGLPADGGRGTGATAAQVQQYIDAVTEVRMVIDVDGYELCTPDGQHTPIGPGKQYPYLEHRQIGR